MQPIQALEQKVKDLDYICSSQKDYIEELIKGQVVLKAQLVAQVEITQSLSDKLSSTKCRIEWAERVEGAFVDIMRRSKEQTQ